MAYKPAIPFNVPMRLLIPTLSDSYGVASKTYPPLTDGILFFGSFRTFGGTESESNGVYTLLDTATVDTWYRPDITADCRVFVTETGKLYEIIGQPENIDMRNQFLKLTLRAVGGVA